MTGSTSKPTFVHYFCVALFMACLVLGVIAFLSHRDFTNQSAQLTRAQEELTRSDTALRQADDDREALKEVLGYEYSRIGTDDPEDPDTVIGRAIADIRKYAGELAEENMRTALLKLDADRTNPMRTLDAITVDKANLQKSLNALRERWTALLEIEKEARKRADRTVVDSIATHEEIVKAKNELIEEFQRLTLQQSRDLVALEDTLENKTKEWSQRRRNYDAAVRRLNDIIRQRDPERFEVADGRITWIDRLTRRVWIDLGSRDYLKTGVVFGVFAQDDDGLVFEKRRPKATVRVTRVTGPHTAEGRIIGEATLDLVLKGDEIYTPFWSPGRMESFAFVGLLDLNGDGRSDIEELEAVVADADAKLRTYVDDNGERVGGKIDLDVKFLVIGRIPDPEDAKSREQLAAFNKIIAHVTEMRQEANEHGVRIVNLNDFLDYTRYRPTRRRNGRGTSISGRPAGISKPSPSTGRTSRLYDPSRPVAPSPSTGTTSGLFRSGRSR